jgi:hypothetical protein
MKRLLVLAALGAVAFTPVVAQADTVYAGDTVKVQPGASRFSGGGELILTDLTAPADPASFVTFCLESNEFLEFGVNLTVLSVTDRAIKGGTGGGNPDPLDTRSAYIYYKYRTGNPHGWSGSEVQQAIWWIEEERTANGAPTAPAWVTDGTLAGYISAAGWTGIGPVRVLNIYYDGQGGGGQDLLTIPEPGSLMLLGIGLVGLAGAARRRVR